MSVIKFSPIESKVVSAIRALAGGTGSLAKDLCALVKAAKRGTALARLDAAYDAARDQLMRESTAEAADKALAKHSVHNIIAKARRVASFVDAQGWAGLPEKARKSSSIAVIANLLSDEGKEKTEPGTGTVHKISDTEPVAPAVKVEPVYTIGGAIDFLADGDDALRSALALALASEANSAAFVAWVRAGMAAPAVKAAKPAKVKKAA